MKTTRAIGSTLTVLGCLLAGGQAQAAEPAVYLLGAGGSSHHNNDCTGTTNCDNTGNAFKLLGGYRFGNGVAIEATSFDFGKSKASALGINLELKAKAVGLGAAVYAELAPSWVGTLRLGVASVKMTATGSNGYNSSESSTNAYVGLAIAYHFTPAVSAELGYDSTKGKILGESGNISAVTVGVGVKF